MIKYILLTFLILFSGLAFGAEKTPIVFQSATSAQIEELQAGDTISGTSILGPDSISDTVIDWGTGANQVSAADVPIADAGTFLDATEVEAALQELFAGMDWADTVKIRFGTGNDFEIFFDATQGKIDVPGAQLFLQPSAGGNIRIGATANSVADSITDGVRLVVERHTDDNSENDTFELYIDSFRNAIFLSTGGMGFQATGTFEIQTSKDFSVQLFRNAPSNVNTHLRQYGDIGGVEKYVQWELDDTHDYFSLVRVDNTVLGLALLDDDFPLSLGATVGDFTLRYDGATSGDAIIDLAAGDLQLYPSAGGNVTFFEDAGAGENPSIKIYGDDSGAPVWWEMYMDSSGDATFNNNTAGGFVFLDSITGTLISGTTIDGSVVGSFKDIKVGDNTAGQHLIEFDEDGPSGILNWDSPNNRFEMSPTRIGDGTAGVNYVGISETGVTFVGSAGLIYGGISVTENAVETVIDTAGVKFQVTIFARNAPSNNTTPDTTTADITIIVAGDYLITVSVTINSVSGAASVVEIEVMKNDGASRLGDLHADRSLGGGGTESGSTSMSDIVTLAVSDTVEVWIENETNTQNYIVEDITLSILHVGGGG